MSTLPIPRDGAQVASFASLDDLPDAAQALFDAPALDFQSSRAWYEVVGATAVPAGSRPVYLLCAEAGRPVAVFPLLDGADGARTSLTTPYTTLYHPLVAPGLDDAALRRAFGAFGLACRAWPTMRIEALDADWTGLPEGIAVAVGNVGFAGRVDYTIVGRTVNVAQALEQCGRQVMGKGEVVILASDATARGAGDQFAFEPCPQINVSGATQALRLAQPA